MTLSARVVVDSFTRLTLLGHALYRGAATQVDAGTSAVRLRDLHERVSLGLGRFEGFF